MFAKSAAFTYHLGLGLDLKQQNIKKYKCIIVRIGWSKVSFNIIVIEITVILQCNLPIYYNLKDDLCERICFFSNLIKSSKPKTSPFEI